MNNETISQTASAFMDMIGREILWCNEHPDKAFTAEYRKGFVNGLIQARLLIKQVCDEIEKGEYETEEDDGFDEDCDVQLGFITYYDDDDED